MRRQIIQIILLTVSIAARVFSDAAVIKRNIQISRQNLVPDTRVGWQQDQPVMNPAQNTKSVQYLNVLAIMVEFQEDNDNRTTGDGKFDLLVPEDLIIDPPPHNRSYFQDQLSALSNYYRTVSNGKLIITGDVHEQVFTLPHEMGYYNPATTDEAENTGLAELFRDAIKAADEDGALFSNYDVYMIFHAGVGRDIDFGYDPTPQDIPSVFLGLDDLLPYLDDMSADGIVVQNGDHVVREGIILPETENQDGVELGLLGTAAIMFGFQIGLPALWDTQTGNSGIGTWGLMDQGSANFSGLIPAEPCAFSKVFMGWETPLVIQNEQDLEIACSAAGNRNKIYKIPINDDEYFLLENRIHDFNGDGIAKGKDRQGREVTFLSNGQIELSETVGVIVEVDEYDFGLHGSGILIWHIDEAVVLENLAANRVNADKKHRGVDLEEADGAQDIGEDYGFLSGGSGAESGVLHDVWFGSNDVNMLVNGTETVAFTPDSYPNSRSYSGANSHIVIHEFSDSDTIMTFSVTTDWLHADFPAYFGENNTPFPPLFGDIDGDDETEIIVATQEGKIFAWEADGSPVIASDALESQRLISGDTSQVSVALLADLELSLTVAPIISSTSNGDINKIAIAGDGTVETLEIQNGSLVRSTLYEFEDETVTLLHCIQDYLIIGTDNRLVKGVSLSDDRLDFSILLPDSDIRGVCEAEREGKKVLIVTTGNNALYVYQINPLGFPVPEYTIQTNASLKSPVSVKDVSEDMVVVAADDGKGYLFDTDNNLMGEYDTDTTQTVPALADLDGDGILDIVTTSSGQFRVFNPTSRKTNFPVPHYTRDLTLSSPVLGDVNGDGLTDILAATSDGSIEAWQTDGNPVEGFPLSMGGSASISPVLLDLDSDGLIELAAISESGHLFVWDLEGACTAESVPWGSELHDPQRTGRNGLTGQAPVTEELLLPERFAYNYPNPAYDNSTTIRYRLGRPADVEIRIFDLSGQLLDHFKGPGDGPADNEVVWGLEDIESGTYFCQIRAASDGDEKVTTIKVAVIK